MLVDVFGRRPLLSVVDPVPGAPGTGRRGPAPAKRPTTQPAPHVPFDTDLRPLHPMRRRLTHHERPVTRHTTYTTRALDACAVPYTDY
jgi:hypothetical protein